MKHKVLEELLSLFEHDKRDEALDLLYDRVDEMLEEGQFQELDRLLCTASQNDLPMVALLSLLTATLPWKKKLMERTTLVDTVRRRVINEEGEAKLHAILSGLE